MTLKSTKVLTGLLVVALILPQSFTMSFATETKTLPPVPVVDTTEEDSVRVDLIKEAVKLGVEVQDTDTLLDLYDKIDKAKDAGSLKDLQGKAKEMGIKIDGLSYEEAIAKISKELSKVQTNDPKVVAKQKTLMNALLDKNITATDEKAYKASVVAMAQQLELNISGLSVKAAIKKVKEELGDLNLEGATNSTLNRSILDAVYNLRIKNKAAFMKIVQTGAFDKIFKMEFSKLPYEKASYYMIETLKAHEKIDIYKGKWEDLKNKLLTMIRDGLKQEAVFFKVDITGLSDADAEAKIDVARQIMMANEMVEMQKYADIYKVDVTGLSKEEGWAKIKAVIAAQDEASQKEFEAMADLYNVSIKGLSKEDAKERVNQAALNTEAAKVGINVSGMPYEQAWKVVKEAQAAIPRENTLEQEAAKWSVDITGLSVEDAKAKVDAARKAVEMSKATAPPPSNPTTPPADGTTTPTTPTTPTEPTAPTVPK